MEQILEAEISPQGTFVRERFISDWGVGLQFLRYVTHSKLWTEALIPPPPSYSNELLSIHPL